MVWPDTDRAVHTMPAMAITKNMPDSPDTPNRSSTTDDTMIVSIVMPDTGLRATVAIALAATDAKKNENTSVRPRPTTTTVTEETRLPKKTAAVSEATTTPMRMVTIGTSRSVRSSVADLPERNAFTAIPSEPATIFSDLRIPKIPAVAMAPTPMNRT